MALEKLTRRTSQNVVDHVFSNVALIQVDLRRRRCLLLLLFFCHRCSNNNRIYALFRVVDTTNTDVGRRFSWLLPGNLCIILLLLLVLRNPAVTIVINLGVTATALTIFAAFSLLLQRRVLLVP